MLLFLNIKQGSDENSDISLRKQIKGYLSVLNHGHIQRVIPTCLNIKCLSNRRLNEKGQQRSISVSNAQLKAYLAMNKE